MLEAAEGKEEKRESNFKIRMRRRWVDNRERVAEFYRLYFHTIAVTLLMIMNLFLAYSSFIIYFAQWKHVEGVKGFLTVFTDHPSILLTVFMELFYYPLDRHPLIWLFVVLNLPIFTWLYSTNSLPIKKGYKILLTWKSKRGRIAALLLSAIPLMIHYCAMFAWYVEHYLFDFFASIQSDKDYLLIKSMSSFGYLLMCIPVFIVAMGAFKVSKQFHMNEDLRKIFFKWEFALLAKQSFSLTSKNSDVIVGWEKKTNKPIILHEKSRYLHELVVGATGTGKTSTTILMRIMQDLIRIARGRKLGICVLEPKGDLIRDILKLSEKLKIPKEKIMIVDPTDLVRSTKFNPFIGPLEVAAETFRGVLDALAGDQDEFFKGQQSETASLYTMLGKIRYQNMFNIIHMQKMYTDPRYLADMTEQVRDWIGKNNAKTDLTKEEKILLDRYERVVSYFENDILDYKTYKDKEQKIQKVVYPEGHKYAGKQVVENKKDKFITGAKKYVNDICMNAMLSELMIPSEGEEPLDIDKFLRNGGILLVNTALGELEELSLSFGQFFIRQFQSSVFRRAAETNVVSRIPIFFDIDEFPLYINQAFERLLTLGRSYNVGTLIAIQSLGQLETVVAGYDKVIMSNASNKTVFGRGVFEDNERFSKQFGEEYEVEESMNESTTPVSMPTPSWGLRYNTARALAPRFSPTAIMEQEFKDFIVQMVDEDQSIRVPVQGYGKFINETKFLKKFLNIGKVELETKKYKPLNLAPYKDLIANLIPVKPEETNVNIVPEQSTPPTEPDKLTSSPPVNTVPSAVPQSNDEDVFVPMAAPVPMPAPAPIAAPVPIFDPGNTIVVNENGDPQILNPENSSTGPASGSSLIWEAADLQQDEQPKYYSPSSDLNFNMEKSIDAFMKEVRTDSQSVEDKANLFNASVGVDDLDSSYPNSIDELFADDSDTSMFQEDIPTNELEDSTIPEKGEYHPQANTEIDYPKNQTENLVLTTPQQSIANDRVAKTARVVNDDI